MSFPIKTAPMSFYFYILRIDRNRDFFTRVFYTVTSIKIQTIVASTHVQILNKYFGHIF